MNKFLLSIFVPCYFFAFVVHATEIDTNTAKLQAMDKITGRVSMIDVPVNAEKKFGSLSIVVRSCKTRPAEETPDNFGFIDITDTTLDGKEYNIFKGWMISSSPATHALEHPIYDIWLLQCLDTKVDEKLLLDSAALEARDLIPMTQAPQKNADSTPNEATQQQLTIDDSIDELSTDNNRPEDTAPENLLMSDEFSFDEESDIAIEDETEANDSLSID